MPKLTRRQLEVARTLLEGYSTKEIARRLGLSPRTVEDHRGALTEAFAAKTPVHLGGMLAAYFNPPTTELS